MMSSPPRALMRSLCRVPGRKSLPFVPVMVAAQAAAETTSRPATTSATPTRSCVTIVSPRRSADELPEHAGPARHALAVGGDGVRAIGVDPVEAGAATDDVPL